jgi:ABC-type antimicrobial peptide transport system permease subunit
MQLLLLLLLMLLLLLLLLLSSASWLVNARDEGVGNQRRVKLLAGMGDHSFMVACCLAFDFGVSRVHVQGLDNMFGLGPTRNVRSCTVL